jgi:hypothetical protein
MRNIEIWFSKYVDLDFPLSFWYYGWQLDLTVTGILRKVTDLEKGELLVLIFSRVAGCFGIGLLVTGTWLPVGL